MSRTLVDVQYMLFSANTSSLDLAIITITRQSQFPKSVSTIKYLLLFGCRNICLKCKNAIIQVPVGQHGRCNKGLYLAPSSMKHHQRIMCAFVRHSQQPNYPNKKYDAPPSLGPYAYMDWFFSSIHVPRQPQKGARCRPNSNETKAIARWWARRGWQTPRSITLNLPVARMLSGLPWLMRPMHSARRN